ncbi:MAG TPA: VIT1/CCC1 transporter family protein [Spirochaetota bacterium]|nr:VIT1/CCC1 transporter family protein [Spirochaetota bacterium]HPI88398.1 VIT1/CCC1 transporter family protein [Spirochaetota bacterium]HPR46744.1 VIT1/CCC1 transporter family protein [Spirochaetota bacterium]
MTNNSDLIKKILVFQKNEITEHIIYTRLATKVKDKHNSALLKRIGDDELRHYHLIKKYSGQDVRPSRWKIMKFFWISRIFGLTFGIKLMEKGEDSAQMSYSEFIGQVEEINDIIKDENGHEQELIGLIEEERLKYMGSVVLGLNDALVELTGALAGLSFALQNTRLIALAGLITGIAAALSMAASEYLSTKSEEGENALTASIYTGIAYIGTVAILITPYLILENYMICLAATMINAVLIIALFNYYISVARDLSFKKRFFEMAGISLGVAALSFGIGFGIRTLLGIDV